MNDWAVVTVVTRNYLHFARALAHSLRALHPRIRVIACVVDPLPKGLKADAEPFEIISFEILGVSRPKRFLFQYTPFELTCALKSYVLLHVFGRTDLQKLLYLDSDIQVYDELTPLLKKLDSHQIILTPHLSQPKSLKEPDRWEMDVLDSGVFNGGFLGLRKSETSLAMLAWWRQRMEKWCIQEHQHDQKWLNGLPALFDDVCIERSTQYNVAPWNTGDRRFAENKQGRVLVDDQPMVFFHFASIDPDQNKMLSRISRFPLTEEHSLVQRLFREYVARLEGCGLRECRSWGYEYSHLADGTPILPAWRELVRIEHPRFGDVEDPFSLPAAMYRSTALTESWKRQSRRVLRGLNLSK